jgi:SAM-dependent methyltransferase
VNQDTLSLIRERILSDPDFVSAVFSGHRPHASPPWVKVTVRPVLIKRQRMLQFEYFDTMKGITGNHDGPEAAAKLDEALALPFRHFYVRGLRTGLQVQITQKGRALVRELRIKDGPAAPDLAHDRRKKRPLDPEARGDFLRAIGLAAADGRIKPTMQAKFRQVSEFLRLLEGRIPPAAAMTPAAPGAPGAPAPAPLRVVDLGCGNAYLTFAVFDYLSHVRGLPAVVTGVDVNAQVIERHRETCRGLQWEGLAFEVSSIEGCRIEPPPDIVMALHACDTATDEALARAVAWRARLLFAAPCCHHHLQAQMGGRSGGSVLQPLMRFGILKERLGDMLTDTLRAQILGMLGYRVDIVQFVSPEHTAKNIMLIAERREGPVDAEAARQYRDLCGMFGVRPRLEELLAEALAPVLGA